MFVGINHKFNCSHSSSTLLVQHQTSYIKKRTHNFLLHTIQMSSPSVEKCIYSAEVINIQNTRLCFPNGITTKFKLHHDSKLLLVRQIKKVEICFSLTGMDYVCLKFSSHLYKILPKFYGLLERGLRRNLEEFRLSNNKSEFNFYFLTSRILNMKVSSYYRALTVFHRVLGFVRYLERGAD